MVMQHRRSSERIAKNLSSRLRREAIDAQCRKRIGRHARRGARDEICDHFSRAAGESPTGGAVSCVDEQEWVKRIADNGQAVGRQQAQAFPSMSRGNSGGAGNPIVRRLREQRGARFQLSLIHI